MIKTKIALHWLILIGMGAGILFGLLAVMAGWHDFTTDWIKPWGTIFIKLLKLIAVPLIIVSLINGISNLNDVSKLSRIGLKTISLYLLTTVIAITVGLMVVNITQPGKLLPEEKSREFQEKYAANVAATDQTITDEGPLQFITDIVPDNIFLAMTENTSMLQVIFFSILFGISMILIPTEKTRPVKVFFESLNEIVLQMIHLIMWIAPYGVFALIASITVEVAGDQIADTAALFGSLGLYALTVVIGLLLLVFVIYPLIISLLTVIGFKQFIKGLSPAQLLAFSTSSSAATLPMTMQCCEENLGVKKEVSSFVLPLGATINMDGTSLYQAVAAVFLAQIYGMDLSLMQQLTIVLTATLASIGSAAVPGAGMIMLVIVLGAVGIPTEGIALIFAVDRPLDMLRTVVNITGDASIACAVAHTENKLDETLIIENKEYF
ncbi:MAG: dicarboxylate/amino acid:cation symporter [Bacteroidetes bacterium]|nr:dicarboxylate/amino acid:cation symporter [Bacteroidota bacterium]MBU1578746.1 dicarboxylate/amino acid:cation symporter [Bacteroidota bacterium]MBU2558283.1 dicarboxylate/amino acid:cation symporter [Bacteroidota bacterium]